MEVDVTQRATVKLTGGPWDGREFQLAQGERLIVIPFVPTAEQVDDACAAIWIGTILGFGEIRYRDGAYEGAFMRAACCRDDLNHWTRRGTRRNIQPHPDGGMDIRVRDWEPGLVRWVELPVTDHMQT